MNFLSRSVSRAGGPGAEKAKGSPGVVPYDSVIRVHSKTAPGVEFTIHKISFGRRMELTRRIREISQRAEFQEAGSQLQDKIDANILSQEVDAMYIRWGLVSIEGLTIDGEPATADQLMASGPEPLAREIVDAIKSQCGLSESERKN